MTIAVGLTVASYLKPAGSSDELPDYTAIAPMRGFMWSFFVIAGINLIVGACAVAVAGLILTPARGAHWATVGAGLVWLGAATYGVGTGTWAASYYVATQPPLGAAQGTALVERINHDTLHMHVVPISGAALVLMGSLVMSVGVWRARSIPRWIVGAGVVASLATFLVAPSTIAGITAEAVSSATAIAIGWYAWRRTPARALNSGRTDRHAMDKGRPHPSDHPVS